MSGSVAMGSRKAGLRNEEIVLSLLKQHGELSQAQLCKLAGLSSSTASYIVGRLRDKGLILEREGVSKRRGARPIILTIRPDGRFAVGAEIRPNCVFVGVFNFVGELIETVEAPLGDGNTPEQVLRVLEMNLRGILSKHDITQDKLIGIGVTLSGSLSRDGVVEMSAPLGWKDIPFEKMMQVVFPNTFIRLYTTRVRLLAEMETNGMADAENLVLLNVANGVGTAIIIDGRMLHGSTNRSGELGHVIFEPDGELCGCGNRGCLETLISGPAMARRIRHDIANGTETSIAKKISDELIPEAVVGLWSEAVEQGDAYALQIREFVGKYVADCAAIAINCFDPEKLIIAGYVMDPIRDYLIERIEARIPEAVYDNVARKVDIIPAQAGANALVRGTAVALLQRPVTLK